MMVTKIIAAILFSTLLLRGATSAQEKTPGPQNAEQKPTSSTAVSKIDAATERDLDALAFLIASYWAKFHDAAWAPSADPLWGVLSQHIYAGNPVTRGIWQHDEDVKKWSELLEAQKLGGPVHRTSQLAINIILPGEGNPSFYVVPHEVQEGKLLTIDILFSRSYYVEDLYRGAGAGQLGSSPGKDLLDSWKGVATKTQRSEVELTSRYLSLAGAFWRLNFLLSGNNLKQMDDCLYGSKPQTEKEVSDCADFIWAYETGASKTILNATEHLPVCLKPGGCKSRNDYTILVMSNMELYLYPEPIPGARASKSGLKNYVHSVLDRVYSKLAKKYGEYKKIWDKKVGAKRKKEKQDKTE